MDSRLRWHLGALYGIVILLLIYCIQLDGEIAKMQKEQENWTTLLVEHVREHQDE